MSIIVAQKKKPTEAQITSTMLTSAKTQGFVIAMSDHERSFFYTWRDEPLLTDFVTGGALRGGMAEAAAQLLGTLAVRMYSDCLSVRRPLIGWTPMSVDPRAEHRSVSIVIPLMVAEPGAPFLQVLAGSHHAVGAAMSAGKIVSIDASPFSSLPFTAVLPGLVDEHESCLIPCPAPGSCLFLHNHLARSMHPLMTDAAVRPGTVPSVFEGTAVTYFTLSIIPDGMVHDGASRGWLTDNPQGPMHGMQKGAMVNCPVRFPLLYAAEGLE